ncbi:uncharacterized protein LOC132198157 isoform X2 [Neocloeon triangulifer]|uniref:uncharacterized protein LOC132198157 isoform X2 n=1 Tax=Neocloeon triangulifer TaxID=2078957 RepID=UPI00286EF07D|nr:uncharacterized protein LOC132198157 isoform X2 [Neocloeon triangulifer]
MASNNSSSYDRVMRTAILADSCGILRHIEEQTDLFPPLFLQSDPDELKTSASVFLKKGDFWNSIVSFNKSILMTSEGSEERGLLYFKRSGVLFTLGFYQESISDAQLALKNNCPEKFAARLHLLIARAKKALGLKDEAEEEMKTIKQIIDKMKIKPEAKLRGKDCLRKEFEEKHKPVMPRIRVEYLPPPPLTSGPNPEDPRV